HKELGVARYDLACCKTRRDMNGTNTPEWEHWSRRHYEAAEAADLTAAKLRVTEQTNDPHQWGALSTQQRHEVRTQIAADDPSLATPAAPRSLEDALHRYADRAEGTEPIPDDLAHLAHPPYKPAAGGDGGTAAGAEPESGDDSSQTSPVDEAQPSPAGRSQRQVSAQQRQRNGRGRGARAALRQVRSGSQRLHPDRLAGKTGDIDLGATNGADTGPPLDPTGLFMLFEMLPQ
ncbi:MAG: hypothetical protein L0H59_10460, partial [Tomitella sp.]|nr:hypothetical protein [Tomitella sp.]